MTSRGRTPSWIDPQLDANVLIRLLHGEPEFVAYAQANQGNGLSYNQATCAEFLTLGFGTPTQLQGLERQYGIQLIQDVTMPEIEAAALRLRAAFQGNPHGRVLREADARVAATAFLKRERLATGDLQLFKRAKDLGLDVEFVGSGRAAARAAAYQPRPVTIAGP